MRAEAAEFSVGVEASGWELMLEFARTGMGIAVVNDFCPTPRGCVALKIRSLPEATYSVVHRKTTNAAVQKLHRDILATAAPA